MPAKRNNAKADEMFNLYKKGFSLAQVAEAFAITRQAVFKIFKVRKFALRAIAPLPFIEYGGKRYAISFNGYYRQTDGTRSYLHRNKWIDLNGDIPKGWDVHHRDEDKTNNEIGNYELLKKDAHAKLHSLTNEAAITTRFKKGRKIPHHP